jgi:hypothetical protein
LVVVHCAFSFGEKNGELYQLTTFLRKLQLLSETAIVNMGIFVIKPGGVPTRFHGKPARSALGQSGWI